MKKIERQFGKTCRKWFPSIWSTSLFKRSYLTNRVKIFSRKSQIPDQVCGNCRMRRRQTNELENNDFVTNARPLNEIWPGYLINKPFKNQQNRNFYEGNSCFSVKNLYATKMFRIYYVDDTWRINFFILERLCFQKYWKR